MSKDISLTKSELKSIEQFDLSHLENELDRIEFGERAVDGVPEHIAILCDGNRRWAQEKGLPEIEGHVIGAENVIRLLHRAGELGVKVLTVWVGDTKNLKKRGKEEVKNLLKILLQYALLFKRKYLDQDVRFRHIGARKLLPKKVRNLLVELETETRHKKMATLNVAFNYGGRDEIVRSIQSMIKDGINPEDVTEEKVAEYLDTSDVGDPDMIIRTGGEVRLSGFMSWQSAPSELFFSEKLFPDFTPDAFEEMVKEFPKRNRRLGK